MMGLWALNSSHPIPLLQLGTIGIGGYRVPSTRRTSTSAQRRQATYAEDWATAYTRPGTVVSVTGARVVVLATAPPPTAARATSAAGIAKTRRFT